jgi:hypothetical protein
MRLITNLQIASRCEPRTLPRPSNIYQKQGLSYERRVKREITNLAKLNNFRYEYQPWFKFYDHNGIGQAAPDLILYVNNTLIIIEVKLTFKFDALEKLQKLYLPIVSKALNKPKIKTVQICKNLLPDVPKLILTLNEVLKCVDIIPTYHFLAMKNEKIVWK